jgi:hypothetical protein
MRCECQKPGTLNSGLKGILVSVPDKLGRRYIERCDACEVYHCDGAAGLEYARIRGGGCRSDKGELVLWTPK